MSRIGNKPVWIPEKVKIDLDGDKILVDGPKGSLDLDKHPAVELKVEDGNVIVSTDKKDRKKVALQGLFRAHVANMVTGVTSGYEKKLLLAGIGYRAEAKGQSLVLNVGYSNPVDFSLPEGISATVNNNTEITISGINKELVGEIAAKIRDLRPPEPYKGKGIMYADERIIKKAGKTAGK